MVEFNPTVTANYALQFFADDESSHSHIWIDKVEIENIPQGMVLMFE